MAEENSEEKAVLKAEETKTLPQEEQNTEQKESGGQIATTDESVEEPLPNEPELEGQDLKDMKKFVRLEKEILERS